MINYNLIILSMGLLVCGLACKQKTPMPAEQREAEIEKWKIHDESRPLPPVIDPGPAGPPATPPSDAKMLFEGGELSQWENVKGSPAEWRLEDDYMEVVKKSGSIRTKEGFGDCQLHIEWASPSKVSGESQERGNSGVFLMGLYEIQVLDNFLNRTYADGMAGAVYGQFPPLANACRPPGEWQSYDIAFARPRFNKEGELVSPARMTVFHNGILIQNNVILLGPTEWKVRIPYKAHADRLPLMLQDHDNPVRFRNVWIRDLEKRGLND